jgi:hypothetical protein
MYIGLHVKVPLSLTDFKENWIIFTDFRKNTDMSNLNKIRPVGAEFQANRRTDIFDEFNSRFSHFANATKKLRMKIFL